MNKVLIIGLVSMLALATSPVHGAETISAHYDLAVGVAGVSAITYAPCNPTWDDIFNGPDVFIGPNETYGTPGDGTGPVFDEALTQACALGRTPLHPDGDGGIVNIGIDRQLLNIPEGFSEFTASVTDDNFDNTYFSFCVITAFTDGGADNTCNSGDPDGITDDTQDFLVQGCGSQTLTLEGTQTGPDDNVGAFVYTAYANEDTLETCFGSSGDMTVVFG